LNVISFVFNIISQIENMRQGGNHQIRDFFEKLKIENSPIEVLYQTKAAGHYREKLKDHVMLVLNGTIPRQIQSSKKRIKSSSNSKSFLTSDDLKSPPTVNSEYTFLQGPMGLTLERDYRDRAVVSRLVPGGPAQAKGICIGDIVEGIAGRRVRNYDELMHMIPLMPRPLQILFSRVAETTLTTAPQTEISQKVPLAKIKKARVKEGEVGERREVETKVFRIRADGFSETPSEKVFEQRLNENDIERAGASHSRGDNPQDRDRGSDALEASTSPDQHRPSPSSPSSPSPLPLPGDQYRQDQDQDDGDDVVEVAVG
jgi:hypothetical protein